MTTYKVSIDGCTLQEYKTLLGLLNKHMGFDLNGDGRIHLDAEGINQEVKAE